MMVSPLSPLFHQLFNQVAVNGKSTGRPLLAIGNGNGSNSLVNSVASDQPPLDATQSLLPPALPPVRVPKGLWLKDVLNKDEEKPSRVAINSLIEEEK